MEKVRLGMITERKNYEQIVVLFGTYKNLLMSIARKYLDNPLDCEEIIQDACVKVIEKADVVYGLTLNQQITYIAKAVENLSRNKIEKRHNNKTVYLTDDEWEYLPGKEQSVEELIHIKDSNARAKKMLEVLTPLDRTLLEGKFILGFTNNELAHLVGCSASTVAVKLHRAKKHAAALWRGKDFDNE